MKKFLLLTLTLFLFGCGSSKTSTKFSYGPCYTTASDTYFLMPDLNEPPDTAALPFSEASEKISKIFEERGLKVVSDAAQATYTVYVTYGARFYDSVEAKSIVEEPPFFAYASLWRMKSGTISKLRVIAFSPAGKAWDIQAYKEDTSDVAKAFPDLLDKLKTVLPKHQQQ